MGDYSAKQAAEERAFTRFLICAWIAEMVWVCFFGMKALAHRDSCSLRAFGDARLLFSLNYIVPFWFLLRGLGLLVIGQSDNARTAFVEGTEKIGRWYKAAPTLTFVAMALLAWTVYSVSFRYHVTLEYRDQYPDDLAQIKTTRDSLTGDVARRIFSEEECSEADDRDNSY